MLHNVNHSGYIFHCFQCQIYKRDEKIREIAKDIFNHFKNMLMVNEGQEIDINNQVRNFTIF